MNLNILKKSETAVLLS